MARNGAAIEAVEPAGMDVMPGSIGDDLMIPDTVFARFGERAVGDLKHANRAGSRPIDLERIPGPAPTPVSASNRIATPFHLSQRGKKFRRNHSCRMFLEQRSIIPPGRLRRLSQGGTDRRQDLPGLANHLIHPVKSEPSSYADKAPAEHGTARPRLPHPARLSSEISS